MTAVCTAALAEQLFLALPECCLTIYFTGGAEADAVATLNAELDGALTSLDRKLIELHSRLKERKLSQIFINRSISLCDPDHKQQAFIDTSSAFY